MLRIVQATFRGNELNCKVTATTCNFEGSSYCRRIGAFSPPLKIYRAGSKDFGIYKKNGSTKNVICVYRSVVPLKVFEYICEQWRLQELPVYLFISQFNPHVRSQWRIQKSYLSIILKYEVCLLCSHTRPYVCKVGIKSRRKRQLLLCTLCWHIAKKVIVTKHTHSVQCLLLCFILQAEEKILQVV